MATMKAIQVKTAGGELELVQIEIPEPKENEVRIKVEACGICHGDAVVKEGHMPGIVYPRVPGHEVVGIIDKLGTGVAVWQTGQRVGVGWYGGPCLQCDSCKKKDYANCERFLTTGISFDGGYAEYMTAHMQALTIIPEKLTALEAAPLLCAGRTTFSALRNSGARGGDVVAVLGLGGLGHLAVQFARKLGFYTVALSRGKDKEALAYQLGAHAYIDTQSQNVAAELKKLGGAKVVLATAPNGKAIQDVINGLGWDGQVIIVAGQGEPMQVSPGQLLGGRRSVRGWVSGPTRGKSEDALNFSVISGVLPMIEVFPLEEAAKAFEKMMTSKVHFRSVLKIGE
jgi:D-arabinose 1-dehydrogenase-like Zn-dependent alcohol dehydrogenase